MGFSLFGLSGKDLAIGGITTAFSLIPGAGVVLGPLAGAATSAIWSKAEGKDWDEAIEGGLVDGLLGALPGGKLAGGALRALAKGGGGKLAKLGLQNGAAKLLYGGAKGSAKAAITKGAATSWGERGVKAFGRGVGAAYMNKLYDSMTAGSPTALAELPIRPIS
ncbi:hypothetical protein [Nocardia anaemiae]|uniref:hypothetical protein n=1 Tax=Nocardia anaemiae TaxID=263910 RepID=UPI0007A3D495|nr:hypothetical protein [Nocardia anaemiae]